MAEVEGSSCKVSVVKKGRRRRERRRRGGKGCLALTQKV